MSSQFEDLEDVALALDEAVQFFGNCWPEHAVDVVGMGALLEAYGKVKEAADAAWKLESLLDHKALEKILGDTCDD